MKKIIHLSTTVLLFLIADVAAAANDDEEGESAQLIASEEANCEQAGSARKYRNAYMRARRFRTADVIRSSAGCASPEPEAIIVMAQMDGSIQIFCNRLVESEREYRTAFHRARRIARQRQSRASVEEAQQHCSGAGQLLRSIVGESAAAFELQCHEVSLSELDALDSLLQGRRMRPPYNNLATQTYRCVSRQIAQQ